MMMLNVDNRRREKMQRVIKDNNRMISFAVYT